MKVALPGSALCPAYAQTEPGVYLRVFHELSEAIVITDREQRIVDANTAFLNMTGYAVEELRQQSIALLRSRRHDEGFYDTILQTLGRDGRWSGETWSTRKDGSTFPKRLSITVISGEEPGALYHVGVYSDASVSEESKEHLHYLMHYDALTGLGNRLLLDEELSMGLNQAIRTGASGALLVLDFVGFRGINEALGYRHGDQLLISAAERLRSSARQTDCAVRLGRDEFALVLNNLTSPSDVSHVAENVLDKLQAPYDLGQHHVQPEARIGISLFPGDGDDPDSILMHAETARCRLRQSKGLGYQFFSQDMNEEALERFAITIQMKHALGNNEFRLVYQPQIDLHTDALVGAEALLRWENNQVNGASPATYIPIAEENGLIHEIGAWALRCACEQAMDWMRSGLLSFPISVNVSAKQFKERSFVQRILGILGETGLDPRYLEVELTESLLVEDLQQVRALLRQLKELGISVAVDDFGTGYSSLGYLKSFPIDKLKIDRIFVQSVDTESADRQLAAAIVGVGTALGMTVIAEGVERPTQATVLQELGCAQVQGYLYSRPLSPQGFEKFMSRRSTT